MASRKNVFSIILKVFVYLAMGVTVLSLAGILSYILVNGVKTFKWSLIFGKFSSQNPSMSFAIVTTCVTIFLTLLMAAPLSVFCAVYLTEYAKRGSKIVRYVRLATETLAGIPSIVFGLFGAIFFGTVLGFGYSILTGCFTVAIMLLPVIIRQTEEAIKAVPDLYREGSYGLGASKLRTVFKIVVPSAAPGIVSAIILSMGRIIGETAALIFTLGSVAQLPGSLLDSSRTLAVHMYIATRDGGAAGREVAFLTGTVLVFIIFLMNVAASYIGGKVGKDFEN
ncbi:MAG: phosphate ABC transporter permease PstA [Chitinispirillales bacterium]|jgi:phosphate transport system permease protein|nr:phosphate ABC transporter permease PstA [Chitinispirillales bacterium]